MTTASQKQPAFSREDPGRAYVVRRVTWIGLAANVIHSRTVPNCQDVAVKTLNPPSDPLSNTIRNYSAPKRKKLSQRQPHRRHFLLGVVERTRRGAIGVSVRSVRGLEFRGEAMREWIRDLDNRPGIESVVQDRAELSIRVTL